MENILYKKQNSSASYFERNLKDYYAFCRELKSAAETLPSKTEPVFLCIGTDRMTGDCLGPLVGHKLEKYYGSSGRIFGTLQHPVHALNLQYSLTRIKLRFADPFFIVIDAALGLPGNI